MSAAQPGSPRAGTVFVVDDDDAVRRAVVRVVERAGWTARAFATGAEFLQGVDQSEPACLVLDLSMPGIDGIAVQQELRTRKIELPILFLTGSATVPTAVQALREGAHDFLQKPVDPAVLEQHIDAALRDHARRIQLASAQERFSTLTDREREICELLASGLGSKQIAHKLSISARTVEHHRERVLKKTRASNTAELASLFALARGVKTRAT